MTQSDKTLDQIGTYYNTDKASVFTHPESGNIIIGNDYLVHYERSIAHLRAKPLLLIELGIGYGEEAGNSLKMWEMYFTHKDASIVGVDIEPDRQRFATGRTRVEIGDCGSPEFLGRLGQQYPNADLIIDDASHYWIHQITAFERLFPTLKPGALYIIEDIGTSFNDAVREIYGSPGGADAYATMIGYTGKVVGNGFNHPLDAQLPEIQATSASMIDCLTFIRGAVIVRKRFNG